MRAGQVRCGHCQTVFDGVAHLVSLAPPAEDDDAGVVDEAGMGPPTVTLRSARALGVAPPVGGDAGGKGVLDAATVAFAAPAADAVPTQPAAVAMQDSPRESSKDEAPAEPAADEADAADAADPPHRPRRGMLLWVLGSVLLVVVLAAQAIFHFRDAIAARWPAAAPVLTKACAGVGCAVGPPHDIAELAIQASDLQADPAHRGLLTLTATVRNRSPRTLAYPHLELTLTDAQDQVVVRRVFAPTEYLGGTADLAAGIPANADVAVKLFIDASATTQAGYRLYLFYL